MSEYRVAKCEDTGKLALYQRIPTDHKMWLLIAHEPEFRELAEVLAAAMARAAAEKFMKEFKLTPTQDSAGNEVKEGQ